MPTQEQLLAELEAWKQAVAEYSKSPYEFQGNEPALKWVQRRVRKLLKQKEQVHEQDRLVERPTGNAEGEVEVPGC